MIGSRLALGATALSLAACAGRTPLPAESASAPELAAEHAGEKNPHGSRPPVPPDVVERAAAPFVGVRADGGELLSPEGLLDELARADLVCVGEDHADPLSHYAELVVLAGLVERSGMSGREVGLGLEMVARPEQSALDGYAKLELDEHEFLEESHWSERWGWDFAYYRPQLELARHRGLQLVALNAPRRLTRAVARKGVGSLERELERELPELDLGDREHRAWFDETMRGHPHGNPHHLYAAQVVWDETMAESAARWLGVKLPGRQLVVMAGAGHCRRDAIPGRVLRRLPARVVSVRAVTQGDAEAEKRALGAFDFVLSFEKS